MKGWFDAFRDDGGPTLYSFPNRTPVTGDVSIVAVSVLFATFYVAFLVIFPGVRKQKFTTFSTVTLSLFVGLVILITRLGSAWHVAHTTIIAPYKAFSREKMPSRIGTHIGLMHVNVTLTAIAVGNWTAPDVDYNERFGWEGANDMSANYRDALRRGLPFPILTVAEYFSQGREGFCWGGQYRAAGYFASIMLWASLASWLLMNLLLIAVPRYGAYMKALTGALLIGTNIGYYCMLPKRPLIIYLEGGRLEFKLGWCYWLLLVAGILCFICGVLISIIDLVWPHTFSTVLEVYYGTPYDRHVILEESSDVRYRKRGTAGGGAGGLEDQRGLGSRILRRLSSKARDHGNAAAYYGGNAGVAGVSSASGVSAGASGAMVPGVIENKSFQPDVPKSPWRYPFRRAQQIQAARPNARLQRTISQESGSSIASAAIHISPLHKHALARMLPNPPMNRIRDVEHW
ncbi:dual oxidase maturation factor 1 [Bactrocera oleae]|uniref:dual oxidase maturation factor 1 n=1 Tax=Bactrocera oleae TaxID=104688 RepID=UPI0006B71CA9|nr:dual oxidase maturation factor 1 [Bactrocera oleae]XP_036217927.1 dual oxidase maturation factor 1 [Bactrocera oleae]XP_036217928.1 dual oxidase maturation factor 1 [Bactrocera oleae]XP_036217929.1 dual oxidase maturation factor 1 [Bactrocera oleae]XP_036217930.1 dual oxidase maturation factor 1 [Bactrocera oleae]